MGKQRARIVRTKAALSERNMDIVMEDADKGVELASGNEDPLADSLSPSKLEAEEEANENGEEDEEEELFDGEEFVSDGEDDDESMSDDFDGEEQEEIELPEAVMNDSDEEDDDDDDEEDAGVALDDVQSASIPASLTSFPTATVATDDPSLNPQKPVPYIHDAGHLLISDPNPLPLPSTTVGKGGTTAVESVLASITRDAAQSLITHLLTTCAIQQGSDGVEMILPTPSFAIPREKRVPKPKAPTKWEAFAKKRGIGKFAGHSAGKTNPTDAQGRLQAAGGKMVYDEAKGEWVRKWGYKGRNKDGEDDWLVEVNSGDEKKGGGTAIDPRSAKRAERKERVKRNERAMRANQRRQRVGKPA